MAHKKVKRATLERPRLANSWDKSFKSFRKEGGTCQGVNSRVETVEEAQYLQGQETHNASSA